MNDKIESFIDYMSAYDKDCDTHDESLQVLMRDAAVGLAMRICTTCMELKLLGKLRKYMPAIRSDAMWRFGESIGCCRAGDDLVEIPMRLLDHDEFERFVSECRHSALEMLDEVEMMMHVSASESENPDVSAYFVDQAEMTSSKKREIQGESDNSSTDAKQTCRCDGCSCNQHGGASK